jgi:hypothetical protein
MVLGHIKMMESQLFGKLITNPQKLWFNGFEFSH